MLRQGGQEFTELRILGKIILGHVTEREGGEDWEAETKQTLLMTESQTQILYLQLSYKN